MKKNEEVAIDNLIAEGVNVEVHTSLAANTLITKQSCNTITQDYDTKDLAKTSETELALQLQNSANQNTKKKHSLGPGHRQRLRQRFAKCDIRTLPDYEILEILLYYAIPRKNTKTIAKALLERFGTLSAVISADPMDIITIPEIGHSTIIYIKLLYDLFSRLHLDTKPMSVNILNSWHAVINYCSLTMGFKQTENFRVLFLNKKNLLLADELFDHGTIDKIAIYPREIVKKSVFYNAAAVILVHNHPSGDPSPSEEDIAITKTIMSALMHVNVLLHDHLIIAKNKHFSFRASELL